MSCGRKTICGANEAANTTKPTKPTKGVSSCFYTFVIFVVGYNAIFAK